MGRSGGGNGGHSSGGFGNGHSSGGFTFSDRSSGGDNNDSDIDIDVNVYGYPRYVYVNNESILESVIGLILIIALFVASYIAIYKPTIVDPIDNIKKIIITSYLIVIILLIIIELVMNIMLKKKEKFIQYLGIFFIVTTILLLPFFVIKANLDNTYNESKFEQIYNEQYGNNSDSEQEQKINISLNGIKISTDKEHYIDECVRLYNIFSIKITFMYAVHILLLGLIAFQLIKTKKNNDSKEILKAYDVLLDDEDDGEEKIEKSKE